MTLAIALVLAILLVALILFVTEWIGMDLVALLVLHLRRRHGRDQPCQRGC